MIMFFKNREAFRQYNRNCATAARAIDLGKDHESGRRYARVLNSPAQIKKQQDQDSALKALMHRYNG